MNIFLIIILLLNIIITLYSIYFKEYFKEKGKNLATKEDIKSITEKIENVKNEVSYKNHQKTEWNETNKKILFELHSDYIDLSENHLKNLTIYFNDLIELKIISEHISTLSLKVQNMKNNYYKLYIFENDDQEFMSEICTLINNLSTLSAEIKLHLSRIESYIQIQNKSLDTDNTIYKCLVKKREEELNFVIKILDENINQKNKDLYKFNLLLNNKIKQKYK